MNKKKNNLITKLILGVPFIASAVLCFAIEERWTKMFFAIMLLIVSLYNLFFNSPQKDL